MAKKKKRPGIVVRIISAKKGHWEVYAYLVSGTKFCQGFKDVDGKLWHGYYTFGTRLISNNGKQIADNKDFNNITIARKNIKAVKNSA